MRKWILKSIGFLALLMLASCSGKGSQWASSDKGSASSAVASQSSSPSKTSNSTTASASKENEEALKKAKAYMEDMGPYSKEGLYDQLTALDEGVKSQAARYAVDQLEVDWEQAALTRAQSYLDDENLSRKELLEQLKTEKFTDEEAEYAVEHVQVDWQEQALSAAKAYQENLSLDRASIETRLEENGFSNEEIRYALDHLNN